MPESAPVHRSGSVRAFTPPLKCMKIVLQCIETFGRDMAGPDLSRAPQ